MPTRRSLRLLAAVVAVLGATGLMVATPITAVRSLGAVLLGGCILLLLLWGAWRLYQRALWKVGRRLAFSYFLIGVLPIPMVAFLLGLAAYIVAGHVLGHLYRDAVEELSGELAATAAHRLAEERVPDGESSGADADPIATALYRDGRRVAGDPRLPETWPAWLAARGEEGPGGEGEIAEPSEATAGGEGPRGSAGVADTGAETAGGPAPGPPGGASDSADDGDRAAGDTDPIADEDEAAWVSVGDGGVPTLAAAAGDASDGAVSVWTGDLSRALSEASDVWVRLHGPATEEADRRVRVEVLGKGVTLKTDPERSAAEAAGFFATRAETAPDDSWLARWWDRPFLWWGEVPGPLRGLATGEVVSPLFGVSLNAPPRTLRRHLFSASAEVDVEVWSGLLLFAVLLFWVYAAAALLAGVMIFALSRAVNRLSRATAAVRAGDFSVRIPVRRRDQIGELQRSFNQMAENLEQLVSAATQKELLEKELEIARDLQRSLIPADLPDGERVEFATVFEPSAAIGGDYFDILRLDDGRLAVIVADVSGHGLPTGLRMAMLKAALTILVGEAADPEEILRKLDSVVRLDDDGRFFVTATLAIFDFRDGRLELTNAGHPPTYLLSGGRVREILLPGSPLGGLGHDYGREHLTLVPGDVAVWLSDGFIEAADHAGEPFGYDGVERALAAVAGLAGNGRLVGNAGGLELTASAVRDALVAAVNRHTGGKRIDDDRTLVVMRYR